MFLKISQYLQEITCVESLFNEVAGLSGNSKRHQRKETPTQVLSCEYCEIFKNSLFYRTLPVAASAFNVLTFVTGLTHLWPMLMPYRNQSSGREYQLPDFYVVITLALND